MGRPKALLPLDNTTFLEHILDHHSSLGLPTWVVLGRQRKEIEKQACLSGAVVLVNPQPERGQLSSLKIGIEAAGGCDAVIVHPVDHPLVRRETIQALLDAHATQPSSILLPKYGDRTGHPVLFPAVFYDALLAAPLDVGARFVVRQHSEAVILVPVSDPGVTENIDTPEDYQRIVNLAWDGN